MTKSEICLSIDLGTTGIKAAAFDDQLRCLGSAYVENRLSYPAPGLVEQEPAHFVNSALALAKQLAGELGDLLPVSLEPNRLAKSPHSRRQPPTRHH